MAKVVQEFEFLPSLKNATVDDFAATLPAQPPKGCAPPDYNVDRLDAQRAVGVRLPRGLDTGADHAAGTGSDPKEPEAVTVAGPGAPGVDGIYRKAGRTECNAPVYEHFEFGAAFALVRRPHVSQKTGRVRHGWLLTGRGAPLYGVQTESTTVPSTSWRAFEGPEPLPTVEVHARLSDAFFIAADRAQRLAEAAASRRQWPEALDCASAALRSLDRSGERFGEAFERQTATLLGLRARALREEGRPREALRDALAALGLQPEAAGFATEATAVAALQALGCTGEAAGPVLKEARAGRVLDRGAPCALGVVERWIDATLGRPQAEVPGDGKAATDATLAAAPAAE